MIYNKLLEDCFFNSRHVGRMNKDSRDVEILENHLPGRGGTIQLSVRCNNQGIIKQACFKAYGNPYMIASLEWVCRQLADKSIHDLSNIDYQQIVRLFEIPDTQYPVALRIEDIYNEMVLKLKKKYLEASP